MKKIQMVDLQSQYQKIKPEIDHAIQRIIDSASFVKGPEIKDFERELAQFLGGRSCHLLCKWNRCSTGGAHGPEPEAGR